MSSAVLCVAAFLAAVVVLLACAVAKGHMLTVARYREACALIEQELSAHPEAQAAAAFIHAAGEAHAACTVGELQGALRAGRGRWLRQRAVHLPRPLAAPAPTRRRSDRQAGCITLTWLANLALVAAFVAIFVGAQLLDGPSQIQAEQDVQDEVAALTNSAPVVASVRPQHQSASIPTRMPHASVVANAR